MDLVSVLVVLLCTLVAIFAALYAYGMSNIQEIKDKFPEWDYKEINENESNTTTDADENDVEID
jgi:endo-1,4-beta-D-glucanase Y